MTEQNSEKPVGDSAPETDDTGGASAEKTSVRKTRTRKASAAKVHVGKVDAAKVDAQNLGAETTGTETTGTEMISPGMTGAETTGAEPVTRTRRPGKPKVDPVLAEAVTFAQDALYEIADPEQVGGPLGVTAEGDRLLTHRFAADKPGYRGWEWFVTVARAPRAKKVTVCEIGLLPGAHALIAPPWVPWLERMNDEEKEAHKAEQAQADEG